MSVNASRTVALVDHTKLGRRSIASSIAFDAIHVLITDGKADPVFLKQFRRAEVIIAD